MAKVDIVNSYIAKCDEALFRIDRPAAIRLQDRIVAVFEPEMPQIK